MSFKIEHWNENTINEVIRKIDSSSIDEGAKFALINNLNGWKAASNDPKFQHLSRKIQNNYNHIRRLSKTGDIVKYFSKYEDNKHKDRDTFIEFNKAYPKFITNEKITSYIKGMPFYEREKNHTDFIPIDQLMIGKNYSRTFLSLFYGVDIEYQATFTFKPNTDVAILCDQHIDPHTTLDLKGNSWNNDKTECEYGIATSEQKRTNPHRLRKLKEMLEHKRRVFIFEKDENTGDYTFRGEFNCVREIRVEKGNRFLIKAKLIRLDSDYETEKIKQDIEEIKRDITLAETTKKQLIEARVGQGQYRQALLTKFHHTCIITGINDMDDLLVASHIKPWRSADNDERLDPENGLLLSATYDKLFDKGLISFENDGRIIISSQISKKTAKLLNLVSNVVYDIKPSKSKSKYLKHHRENEFKK